MFSEPEPFGTHFTSSPSQSGMNSQWTIGSRWPMFGPVFSRVIVCTAFERSGCSIGRALGARLQRRVDPNRVQREVLADAARVDRDPGVLADEVASVVCDLDVLEDRVQHALPGDRGLSPRGVRERVAQVLRDVLQRPDVEVRGRVFDRAVQVNVDRRAHLALSAAAAPARRPKTQHSSSELPIIRFRPCVPPAISPQAKSPASVVSPSVSMTRPPFW